MIQLQQSARVNPKVLDFVYRLSVSINHLSLLVRCDNIRDFCFENFKDPKFNLAGPMPTVTVQS